MLGGSSGTAMHDKELENSAKSDHISDKEKKDYPTSTTLVDKIIITHRHADHFGGLKDVLQCLKQLHGEVADTKSNYHPPRIYKFPSHPPNPSTPAKPSPYGHEKMYQSALASLPEGTFTPSPTGQPMHDLSDGQIFSSSEISVNSSPSDLDLTLRVIHTPGHTSDSICLFLEALKDGTRTNVLFTADSILGQGTAVFEDLASYITSLKRLVGGIDDTTSTIGEFKKVYPGHGPVVEDGPALIRTYIEHRMQREMEIVEVLKDFDVSRIDVDADPRLASKGARVEDIVARIYKDYPSSLWKAAEHGILLHLKKLEEEGCVVRIDSNDEAGLRWDLVSTSSKKSACVSDSIL